MKILRRLLSGRCLAHFLLILAFLLITSVPIYAASVSTLGDYDNISVMEILGDYSAVTDNGEANLLPRQDVSREFYARHGDDYDFLVVFTNFDYAMPTAGTKAFFVPVKNDVEGLGIDLYDSTNLYSADGSFLDRLEGLIDMANLESHVLEPTDPGFEKTLQALTHEMLHRWGAYLSFVDDGVESDALLGFGGAHWSFLLDSQGSSLYGNNWRDNGDGTYTSIAPEHALANSYIGRVFSPLELYLMGLHNMHQVPPLTLIESPGIDRSRLPKTGVTIPGSAKEVTVDQIIAAVGERYPAPSPEKTFRTAFIFLTGPDSWSQDDPESMRQLRQIRNLKLEWEKRFSILTDGAALMQTALVHPQDSELNPGPEVVAADASAQPHVNEGVNWLVNNQNQSGFWQDHSGSALRDTATVVDALKPFSAGAGAVTGGQDWLLMATADNNDFHARKLLGLDSADPIEIESLQNADGGWGSASGYRSNPGDSALVLQALSRHGHDNTPVVDKALSYLNAVQGADGGWNSGAGGSTILSTSNVLLALNQYRGKNSNVFDTRIASALSWLDARQNSDGGFGDKFSSVYESSAALRALKADGGSPVRIDRAVDYLLDTQRLNGSWQNSTFQTAMAVKALYAGQVATDFVITSSEIRFSPSTVVSSPSAVTVTATVTNLGDDASVQVKVSLYDGEPALGKLVGEKEIFLQKDSVLDVAFDVVVDDPFDHEYFVQIDNDNRVEEACEWNNKASSLLTVDLPAPGVGFAGLSAEGLEKTGRVDVEVQLASAWDRVITVDYFVDGASTALAGADFNVSGGGLVFAPGETSKTLSFDVLDDVLIEEDETVVLNLINPSAGNLIVDQFVFTIQDDDTPPTVSFSHSLDSGWEHVENLSVPVSLSHAWDQAVTVNYQAVASGGAGTADYSVPDGTVTFNPGETGKLIALRIVDDTLLETDETFTLELIDPVNSSLGSSQFVYTIKDNDTPPVVSFDQPLLSVEESVGSVTLELSLDHPWFSPVSVDLAVIPDGSAKVAEDFEIAPMQVVFNPGETARNFELTILDDHATEPDEVALITIAKVANGSIGTPTMACTIINDDLPPVVKILAPASGTTADKSPALVFSNSAAQVSVTIDGLPVSLISGERLSLAEDRDYVVKVLATDSFGRTGSDEVVISLDTTGPEIDLVSPVAGLLPQNSALLYYLLDEGSVSSIWLDGAEITARSGKKLFGLDDGEHLVRIEAVDSLGNHSFVERAFITAANGVIEQQRQDAPPTLDWSRDMTRTRYDQDGVGAVDEHGNFYLVTEYSYNVYVYKFDADGLPAWPEPALIDLPYPAYAPYGSDSYGGIRVDSCGNVYIAGLTKQNYDYDLFAAKISSDGILDWIREWGAPVNNYINGVHLTAGGDFSVVGQSMDPYDSSSKLLVTTFSPDGATKYGDVLPGSPGRVIVVDNDGNRYTASGTLSKYTKDGVLVWQAIPENNVSMMFFDRAGDLILVGTSVVKINPASGAVLWSVNPDTGTAHWGAADGNNDLYIAGGAAFGEPSVPSLMKFDSYGRKLWSRRSDAPLEGVYYSGQLDNDGHLLLVRSSRDSLDGLREDFVFSVDQYSLNPVPPPDNAPSTYVFRSRSNCGNASYSKGPVVASLTSVDENCGAPDEISMKFKGTKDMLVAALEKGAYAEPTFVEFAGGGNNLSFFAENSSGKGLISLLEVDPVTGIELAILATREVSISAGQFRFVSDLSGLSGVVPAGSTFGVKLSMSTSLRSTNRVRWGGHFGCPTGGRQEISVYEKTIDSLPPGSTINEPFSGSLVRPGYVLLKGTAGDADGSGVKYVEVSTDNKQSWQKATDTSAGYTWSTWTYPWIADTEGMYSLWSRATDNDGNVETSAEAVKVVVESLMPDLVVNPVVSPHNQTTQIISGTTNPDAVITVDLHGSSATSSALTQAADGHWQFSLNNLAANTDNTFDVVSTNLYGSTRETVVITVDTAVPLTINATTPTITASQRLTGTTEAGARLSVEVNPPSEPQDVVVLANGYWQHQVLLKEGANELAFTAIDAIGNQVTKQVTIDYLTMTAGLSRAEIVRDESAELKIKIDNVPSDAELLVEEFLDINGNGLIDVGDPGLRSFNSLQGDQLFRREASAVSALSTTLSYRFINDVHHAPGTHLFRVTYENVESLLSLELLDASYQQALYGFVLDEQGSAVPGAILRGMDKWGRVVGYAFSDHSGSYRLPVAEPGSYIVLPLAAGYVFDKNLQSVATVGTGEDVVQNLTLVAADNKVTGVLKGGYQAKLPGVLIRAESDRYLGLALSDSSGEYELSLPEGNYGFFVDTFTASTTQEVYSTEKPLSTLNVSGSHSGNDLELQKFPSYQSTCSWQVRDQFYAVVAGIPLMGSIDDGTGRTMYSISDDNGWYSIATDLTRVSVNDDAAQSLGLVGNQFSFAQGDCSVMNKALRVRPIEAWIEGVVVDTSGQPVEKVPVSIASSVTGIIVEGRTAFDGTYRLGVHAGDWEVVLHTAVIGSDPVSSVQAFVASAQTARADFVISPPPDPLQLNVSPAATPTDSDAQTLSGSMSEGASVSVAVDTLALVGAVSYPTSTSWECRVSLLEEGLNNIIVTADNGVDVLIVPLVVDYLPPIPLAVSLNPPVTPTELDWQTLSGTMSLGALVRLEVDTTAALDPVSYPSETTWECTVSSLPEGVSSFIVTADDFIETRTLTLSIDYRPVILPNTTVITNATFLSRKKTLLVDATSASPDAALVVEYPGSIVPMTFEKFFKGLYRWSYSEILTSSAPLSITVSGTEGSQTKVVHVK